MLSLVGGMAPGTYIILEATMHSVHFPYPYFFSGMVAAVQAWDLRSESHFRAKAGHQRINIPSAYGSLVP